MAWLVLLSMFKPAENIFCHLTLYIFFKMLEHFYFVYLYTVDLNPANVAIGGVLLLIFALFAILANVIIIAIYTRKNMRSPINTILTGKC